MISIKHILEHMQKVSEKFSMKLQRKPQEDDDGC